MSLPQFRQDIQVTVVGDELIVYNSKDKTAHCFNAVGKIVFQACREGRSVSEILAELHGLPGVTDPQESFNEAMTQFADLGLLTGDFSRRDFFATAGKAAAGILVASMLAPTPAAAASSDDCRCGSSFGRQVLFPNTFNAEAGANHPGLGPFLSTQYCVGAPGQSPPGQADYTYVWIEVEGTGSGLLFDETVTFTVTPVDGGTSLSACYSSWEATPCGGCTPNGGIDQNGITPPALNITPLFPGDGLGNVACGRYLIEANHCNEQGVATVTAFAINTGPTLPLGAVTI